MKNYLLFLFLLGSLTCKGQSSWGLNYTKEEIRNKLRTDNNVSDIAISNEPPHEVFAWHENGIINMNYAVVFNDQLTYPLATYITPIGNASINRFVKYLNENFTIISNKEWVQYYNGKTISIKLDEKYLTDVTTFEMKYN
ncbi:MAG: hypothetical protein LC111_02105 [Bacteroidia bacterium]|nr:hypothetical protein [Bacteroidia bacterium]